MRGEDFDSEEEREKLKALKAEQLKQRMKKMRLGEDVALLGMKKKKPAVTAEEIAAVELDAQDEKLLDQMEQEAEVRRWYFASNLQFLFKCCSNVFYVFSYLRLPFLMRFISCFLT